MHLTEYLFEFHTHFALNLETHSENIRSLPRAPAKEPVPSFKDLGIRGARWCA